MLQDNDDYDSTMPSQMKRCTTNAIQAIMMVCFEKMAYAPCIAMVCLESVLSIVAFCCSAWMYLLQTFSDEKQWTEANVRWQNLFSRNMWAVDLKRQLKVKEPLWLRSKLIWFTYLKMIGPHCMGLPLSHCPCVFFYGHESSFSFFGFHKNHLLLLLLLL